MFDIRTDQYKYIYNWNVWDINELYDIQKDPEEMNNLIRDPKYGVIAHDLKKELWEWLEKTNGMTIPLKKSESRRNRYPYRGSY